MKLEVNDPRTDGQDNEKPQWYKHAYRRNVIDMHITNFDKRFMSQIDPINYVDMLELARVQSAVVYAHSHVGHCYYPSKIAHMSDGLGGRDIFGEIVDECHRRGIAVVGYTSTIFDRYVRETHPEWRMISVEGKPIDTGWRHGLICPNSPYRDYFRTLALEVADYPVDGIRVDMTFWPAACCYCEHCKKRYADEVGGSIPTRIDWFNPRWVAFQRKREEWMAEFGGYITNAIQEKKPEISVEHQSSGYFMDWRFGVDEALAPHNDFLQGDFYGDAVNGSFVRKLFYKLSPNRPYGFETSVCNSINDHTSRKPMDLLRCKAYASIADGGAFVFIDAIDPVGTLNSSTYELMGEIFRETKAYDEYLGGEMVQDVAVYFSAASKCSFSDNGTDLSDPKILTNHVFDKNPHVNAVVGSCDALIRNNIPYGVVTKRSLADLSKYKLVMLPNVLMMSREEADAIREYVRQGGNVYASKWTSLVSREGVKSDDFMLSDLFGVSFAGETVENFTYISPISDDHPFGSASTTHPLAVPDTQLLVEANPGAQVIGTLVLPYTDPKDPDHFSSIHSNPPGIRTEKPSVVVNSFGEGKVIYSSACLESEEIHRATIGSIIRRLCPSPAITSNAPRPVEITVFHQPGERRYIINLLNFQDELPNIPVHNIEVTLNTSEKSIRRIVMAPDKRELAANKCKYSVRFYIDKLETFAMAVAEY